MGGNQSHMTNNNKKRCNTIQSKPTNKGICLLKRCWRTIGETNREAFTKPDSLGHPKQVEPCLPLQYYLLKVEGLEAKDRIEVLLTHCWKVDMINGRIWSQMVPAHVTWLLHHWFDSSRSPLLHVTLPSLPSSFIVNKCKNAKQINKWQDGLNGSVTQKPDPDLHNANFYGIWADDDLRPIDLAIPITEQWSAEAVKRMTCSLVVPVLAS